MPAVNHYLFIIVNNIYHKNYSSFYFEVITVLTFSVVFFVLSKLDNQQHTVIERENLILLQFILTHRLE